MLRPSLVAAARAAATAATDAATAAAGTFGAIPPEAADRETVARWVCDAATRFRSAADAAAALAEGIVIAVQCGEYHRSILLRLALVSFVTLVSE